ncbi:hypothetical protein ACVWWO_000006 [Bradyrhizobium sp. F1.13.1]
MIDNIAKLVGFRLPSGNNKEKPGGNMKTEVRSKLVSALTIATMVALLLPGSVGAQETRIAKTDMQIDALDPGIKLFLRGKVLEGKATSTDDNVVLFLHGATSPSTCDFDLPYKDYSWADCW